jgi:putative endonuclease
MAFAYILQSADGSYNVGSTRTALKRRTGAADARLVWAQKFRLITDAVAMEHRVKRWSHAKKEALITSGFVTIDGIAASPSPRDED